MSLLFTAHHRVTPPELNAHQSNVRDSLVE